MANVFDEVWNDILNHIEIWQPNRVDGSYSFPKDFLVENGDFSEEEYDSVILDVVAALKEAMRPFKHGSSEYVKAFDILKYEDNILYIRENLQGRFNVRNLERQE